MKIRAVMIDDEELARKRLRKLLRKYADELDLVGEGRNGIEALQKIGDLEPDLVFLDIQMPGMSGFDVVRQLRTKPLIVFVTAYDEYALKAFEENSIDYLLKPVGVERLDGTMQKLRRLFGRSGSSSEKNIERLLEQLAHAPLRRLQIKVGERMFFVNVADIVYFEAKEKYCFLHTARQEHIIDLTLGELEIRLDKQDFARIHRSAIVSMNHIREMTKWFGGRLKLTMDDKGGTELIVSRGYSSRFRREAE